MNDWIVKEYPLIENTGRYESVFSLANGKIGTRAFHEFLPNTWVEDAIYMNGFYDSEDYIYGEKAFGFAKKKQKMLALPNMLAYTLVIDGYEVSQDQLELETSMRVLDLQQANLESTYHLRLPNNKQVIISGQRFVSMEYSEVIWQKTAIFSEETIEIEMRPYIAKAETFLDGHDPRLGGLTKPIALHEQETCLFAGGELKTYQTDESKLSLACGYMQLVEIDNNCQPLTEKVMLTAGTTVTFYRLAYYSDAPKQIALHQQAISELVEQGYEVMLQLQASTFNNFWQTQALELAGNPEVLSALRLNVFHLYQHVGKDGVANICAKGLSGEGYEGHYFWDTEVYVLPFFIYTMPEIAKGLLMSRYHMLDDARARAAELSYKGALFPWRTINGQEASAYYPAGTAQIHINADIAYAIDTYYNATKDTAFMESYGIEMLTEIARFYADYADYVENKGWCINGVTGPDEYHTMTNNNAYTNLMVKRQFKKILKYLEVYASTVITAEEKELWLDISQELVVKKVGILTAQDEQFFERKPWDFTRRTERPLLLHYHPMVIYKHQVLKQADLVLAMILCHEDFSEEELLANYEVYEPLTTHDSSLSETMHGIIAARIGKEDEAYRYFKDTVTTDLLDTHGNTKDGIHIAAMAGGWQALVFGFGGLRVENDHICFHPRTTTELQSFAFTIQFRGIQITLTVKDGVPTVTTSQPPVDFTIEVK